jgi:hypothetical protein
MKRMLQVCLLTGIVGLVCAMPMASPVEGTWEGEVSGLKAVTLTVRDAGGKIEGSAIFYVLRDEGEGKRIGGKSEVPLLNATWDGRTLRFSVRPPGVEPDDPNVQFEMIVRGQDTAELKRIEAGTVPAATISMLRQK